MYFVGGRTKKPSSSFDELRWHSPPTTEIQRKSIQIPPSTAKFHLDRSVAEVFKHLESCTSIWKERELQKIM